jgi:mevalonate kinase
VLGSIFCDAVPQGILLEWSSEVPTHSGLGSGGSAFTSMVAAVDSLFDLNASVEDRAAWAHLGDVVAHGGIASALDTQTSLLGGIIEFSGQGLARGLPFAKPPTLVIGDTGVHAATGDVNGRVRAWLDESPKARMHVFRTVGALSRAAAPALARGDWDELGRLMNLNQLALEKIGVTCPEADRLIAAALDAGALGAKVSGSGGGGIIVALATPATKQDVAAAITAAGGKALTPEVAVPGASVEEGTPPQ